MNLVYAFYLLTILPVLVPALSCIGTWQCTPTVSENYNYAECQAGECVCKAHLGFDGNATVASLCRCESPKSVYWKNGLPYCLSFEDSVDTANKLKRTEILKDKVVEIYENLIFPTPTLIITGQKSVDHIFSPTARGRVDPLGTFETRATLVEYFYGLAITPTTKAIAANIKDLFGVDNKVFVRGDFTFQSTVGEVVTVFNLTQTGRYIFDENDLVQSAELIIHNLGKASDPPPEAQPLIIPTICSILTVAPGNCVPAMDPTGHYTSFQDCVDFMSTIPISSFDRAFSNTVSCRVIHGMLTIYDPAVHCTHAGKTGGGKCIDVPYSDYYLEDF